MKENKEVVGGGFSSVKKKTRGIMVSLKEYRVWEIFYREKEEGLKVL